MFVKGYMMPLNSFYFIANINIHTSIEPNFGQPKVTWTELCEQVHEIYHAGALVNHYMRLLDYILRVVRACVRACVM